jgi:hypothetical protein
MAPLDSHVIYLIILIFNDKNTIKYKNLIIFFQIQLINCKILANKCEFRGHI